MSSSLVDVGRGVEAALGAAPGQQHELALAHAQEEARAGTAPLGVAGARAHRAGAVVDRSLAAVGLRADDGAAHEAHGRHARLLRHRTRAREVAHGVDQLGVVLGVGNSIGNL